MNEENKYYVLADYITEWAISKSHVGDENTNKILCGRKFTNNFNYQTGHDEDGGLIRNKTKEEILNVIHPFCKTCLKILNKK